MEVLKFVSALAITFGFLGATLWLLRRRGRLEKPAGSFWRRDPKAKHLCSLERLILSSECTLHLVAIDERPLLLAVSSKGIVPIPIPRSEKQLTQVVGGVR